MIAPALQASLAGRGSSSGGGSQSVADIRRLEEEIMIREEQLRIKEMKLQLQSARMAGSFPSWLPLVVLASFFPKLSIRQLLKDCLKEIYIVYFTIIKLFLCPL